MGLDITSVRYHCWLKNKGINFRRVAMLGRHSFYGMTSRSLAKTIRSCGIQISDAIASSILEEADGYAEPFFRWLGAEVVDSFDYSDYEKATFIWDMNVALPEHHKSNYDFVFDGGTLEHVFRYSEALREAMTLPKKGGVFLSATPANSYLGHGFYQFSPDLAFGALCPKNGYKIGSVHVVEKRHNSKFYEVLPPGQARGRALASTAWPALMYFWGTRNGDIPEILDAHQPDYESAWDGNPHQERVRSSKMNLITGLLDLLPHDVRNDAIRLAKLIYTIIRRNAFFDKKCFSLNKDI